MNSCFRVNLLIESKLLCTALRTCGNPQRPNRKFAGLEGGPCPRLKLKVTLDHSKEFMLANFHLHGARGEIDVAIAWHVMEPFGEEWIKLSCV